MNRSPLGNIFFTTILVLMAVFMVIPFIFTINNAFKPLDEFSLFPPRLFVRNPTLNNFVDLMAILKASWVPFTRYLFNSILVVVLGTGGHIALASMAAYPLAKMRFPGRNLLFGLVILSLMFAAEVTSIPGFLIMSKLGLINTYAGMVLPALIYPVGLFLMKQFMEEVPDSILESARLDGYREFSILWKIVMPMVKPAWLTLLLFNFAYIWNTTNWGVSGGVVVFNEELKTLPYLLVQITWGGIGAMRVFAWEGVVAAINLIMLLPPVIIFILTQSSVIETMASSGLKE
jgi:ABC-type glycerol-3-phosphate transport system permease component